MKIEKAIENLEDLQHGLDLPLMADTDDALRLGIEALKCVERLRSKSCNYRIPLLPGETN